MRKDQVAYAAVRADTILQDKKRELDRKYTTPAKSLTDDEKAVAMAEGRFTVDLSKVGYGRYSCGWANAVTFPEEYGSTFDVEGHRREYKPLLDAYNRLLDELMLGDNAKALELLREFEAK